MSFIFHVKLWSLKSTLQINLFCQFNAAFVNNLHILMSTSSVELMENEDGEKDAECEVADLRLKADSLKQELRECRVELAKLQKQLNQSERLQKSTESYNEDLRKQVSPTQAPAKSHIQKIVVTTSSWQLNCSLLFWWMFYFIKVY